MEELAKRLKAQYRRLVLIHFAKDLYTELCVMIDEVEKAGHDINEFAMNAMMFNNNICELRFLISDTILTHHKETES